MRKRIPGREDPKLRLQITLNTIALNRFSVLKRICVALDLTPRKPYTPLLRFSMTVCKSDIDSAIFSADTPALRIARG